MGHGFHSHVDIPESNQCLTSCRCNIDVTNLEGVASVANEKNINFQFWVAHTNHFWKQIYWCVGLVYHIRRPMLSQSRSVYNETQTATSLWPPFPFRMKKFKHSIGTHNFLQENVISIFHEHPCTIYTQQVKRANMFGLNADDFSNVCGHIDSVKCIAEPQQTSSMHMELKPGCVHWSTKHTQTQLLKHIETHSWGSMLHLLESTQCIHNANISSIYNIKTSGWDLSQLHSWRHVAM